MFAVVKSTLVVYWLAVLNVTVKVAVPSASLTVTSLIVRFAGSLSTIVTVPLTNVSAGSDCPL